MDFLEMSGSNSQMGFPSLDEDTTIKTVTQPMKNLVVATPKKKPAVSAARRPTQVVLPLVDMFPNYLLAQDEELGYGNLVEIYDLLPRFYGWQKKVTEGMDISTEFSGQMRGFRFSVQMTAASIQKKIREPKVVALHGPDDEILPKKSGRKVTVQMFPGVREELVEDALRKFSVSGQGFVDGSQLRVKFTIRDLMVELAKNNHTYSCNEVKEALEILNRAHLSIKMQTENGSVEESTTYLPHLSFAHKRKVVDGEDVCIAQLHPLIVGGIRSNNIRLYGYNKSMEVSSSLARYLHKYLSFTWLNAEVGKGQPMSMLEILSATSRGLVPRMNDNTRFMEKALDELVDHKVLARYEKETIQQPKSKKIVDARYTVFPTNEFVTTIIKGHEKTKPGRAELLRAALPGASRRTAS